MRYVNACEQIVQSIYLEILYFHTYKYQQCIQADHIYNWLSSSAVRTNKGNMAAAWKLEILFSWSLARGGENWRLQSIHCNIAQLTTWGVNVHARVLSIRFCAVQNGAKDLFVLFWKSSVQKKGSCLVYIDRAKQIKLVSKAKQSYVSLVESKMFRCRI